MVLLLACGPQELGELRLKSGSSEERRQQHWLGALLHQGACGAQGNSLSDAVSYLCLVSRHGRQMLPCVPTATILMWAGPHPMGFSSPPTLNYQQLYS